MERSDHKSVYVATFGCQMNEYDSDWVVRLLDGHGFKPTGDPHRADLIFLNTCSIRAKAEQKVYSLLGRLRPLKEARPDLILAVGGCVAQQQGERLLQDVPFLDIVLGTHGLPRLPDLVAEVERTGRQVCSVEFEAQDDEWHIADVLPSRDRGPEQTRIKAYVTIMRGCDNYCAYCVVPYVRGPEVSRPAGEILAEVESLLAAGAKEITLLGQNVNSYGQGLTPVLTFTDLVERVAALNPTRLRFTTSHPKDFSQDLIQAISELAPLAEHVHLPVQSGSTAVLKAMGRGYTREEYLAKVEALRAACPEVALTTDVIVGFPGETEADFEDTLELIRQVRFDGMYSFKYSDRPGTRAHGLDGKVPEEIKGRRLAELQDRQKKITLEINQNLVGRRVEVLADGFGRHPGQLTGRTRSNKVVNFNGSADLIGRIVHPLVTQAWANSLSGTL
ncbi:MAG: tRNA (N6-isopentenyl adenosine(37)-C2)-methylthiotransferase MiaB [Thermodesulfobacteriota bacterium]